MAKSGNIDYLQGSLQWASDIGRSRPTMEDEHHISGDETYTAGFVFDGHGGNEMSSRLRTIFPKLVPEMIQMNPTAVKAAWIGANDDAVDEVLYSGSTATGFIRTDTEWRVYNTGDSRTYIIDTVTRRIVFRTTDHNPKSPSERARIEGVGGFVMDGRVAGMLSVSRAFGDYSITGVIAEPDVTYVTEGDLAVVICDGIIERIQKTADERILATVLDGDSSTMASRLVLLGLETGSRDNLSAMTFKLSRSSRSSSAWSILENDSIVEQDDVSCSRCFEPLFSLSRGKVMAASIVQAPCNHLYHRACISRLYQDGRKCTMCDQFFSIDGTPVELSDLTSVELPSNCSIDLARSTIQSLQR